VRTNKKKMTEVRMMTTESMLISEPDKDSGAETISDRLVLREEPFGGLLFFRRSRHLLRLNHSAFKFVEYLTRYGEANAVEKLADYYHTDSQTISQDLSEVLSVLRKHGLEI